MMELRKFQDLSLNKKVTLEEDGSQNGNLPKSLTDDVLPHVWSNEIFES